MNTFDFDYEFVFNGDFEQDVYDQYPIPDLDDTLLYIVQDIVDSLKFVLTVQPGIHKISSYGTHDDQRLKVTVINTTWVDPILP